MKAILKPGLLLAGLVLAGLALRLLPDGGAGGLLHDWADPAGNGGAAAAALFVAGGAALCAIGVPRQIVAYAAGFAFGTAFGVAAALTAALLGCLVDFWWARLVARDWAQRSMARRLGGRAARLDRFIAANPFVATLSLRLLPVGNNLVLNLLAGISRIAAPPFLAASALGYLPQTVIFALIGSGARIARPTQIGVGVALFAVSALGGTVVMRRLLREGAPVSSEDAPDARYAAVPPAR